MRKLQIIRFVIGLLILSSLYADEGKREGVPEFVFPFWKEMHKLNKYLLESEDHHSYVDIYVNDLAKEPYVSEKSDYPVGSIIVKPLYAKQKRENISRLMIMMKMKSGYDDKNGNWWYGIYDRSGINPIEQGKIVSCIICHEVAEDTDYLFSESVMYKIVSQRIFRNKNSLGNPIK